MSGILTYALHYEGEFNKNSLGAVSEAAKLAQELGQEAHAVVVGDDVTEELAGQLGNYGASKVYYASAPVGIAQPVVDVMAKLIQDHGYSYALFGGGLLGYEIGAGLTARLNAGVTMEVTEVKAQDGKLVAVRPILQDSAVADVGIEPDRVGEAGSKTQVLEINPPPAKEPGEIIEDEDTNETVEKIVAWLDERKLL